MNKGDTAKQYFYDGYNCAQAVAMAFAPEIGQTPEAVARLTIGFGAGMGRMREVCGAMSGITFVLSALFGDRGRAAVYAMVQDAGEAFRQQNGSVVCRELLGLESKGPDVPTPDARTPQYYKKRPCPEIIASSAAFLEAYLKKQNAPAKTDRDV